MEFTDAQRCGEGPIVGEDFLEAALAVVEQIHLVDGQHVFADAEQLCEVAVPSGLGQHPLTGIDQDDGQVCGGRTRDHVARILLVTGCVGDDELAPPGGKKSIGHVDGDALLALGGQAIDQQREIDILPLGAHAPGISLERRELVRENQLAVIEQAANQG